MEQLLTLTQLRSIEKEAENRSIDLISRAGIATSHWVTEKFSRSTKILIVIGRGNNGCDGIAAAIELINNGYKVDFVRLFKDNSPLNDNWYKKLMDLKKPLSRIPNDLNKYGLIIDAVYGIGLTHELDVGTARIIQKLNTHNSFMLSLDAPSGLNPFHGRVQGEAIYADATLTFISDKPGLHTGDGLDYSGEIFVIDLVDVADFNINNSLHQIHFNLPDSISYDILLRSKFNTNKGTYGTVAIIGGNKGMHGALYLAGRSALLSGAGKVVLAPLDKNFRLGFSTPELMQQSLKDVVKNLQAFDAVAIGPGLGKDDKAVKILNKLLDNIEDGKLLVDADALNLISENIVLRNKFREVRYKILTPHPGEAARILGITVNAVQDNRFNALSDLADLLHGVVILKGAGTLIQHDNKIFINATGNPGLANAGQGDTLTGIIIGLLSQGLDILSASRLGVYIHGIAGDRLMMKNCGYNGILASNVADEACEVINSLLYGNLFPPNQYS